MSALWLSVLLAVAVLLAAASRADDLPEGSKCETPSGALGLCKKLSACGPARTALRRKRPVIMCSRVGNYPIVCCPGGKAARNRTVAADTRTEIVNVVPLAPQQDAATPPALSAAAQANDIQLEVGSRPETPSRASQTVGRIARDKCAEYSKYVFVEREPLTPFGDPWKEDTCSVASTMFISGGDRAAEREFPHMARLGYVADGKTEWLCGGTLISPEFVLTAAHCLLLSPDGHAVPLVPVTWVLLGELDHAAETSEGTQMIAVAERIVHERYRPSAKYDDIALLRLQSPARMTGHVRPACLHTEPALRADTDNTNSPIVTGWGFTKEEGVGSDHLLKVAVNVVENDACRAYYESATDDRMRDGIRADSQVCAGGAGRDSCSGDSGGPLQYGPSPSGPYCMYRVAGVVSFGPGLCGMGFPGVYTRVYHYLPWIENIVWPERRPAPAEATPPTAPLVSSQPSGLGWERPAGVHGDRRQPVEDVDSNGAADVTTQGRPRPPHKPEPAGDQGDRPQPVMDVDSNDTSEMATQRRPRPPHKPQNAGVQSDRRQPVVDVDRSGTADMAGRGTPRPEHRVTTKWRQSELKLKYKLAGDSSSPVERGWSSGAAQHELSFWSIFAASLCTLYLIA